MRALHLRRFVGRHEKKHINKHPIRIIVQLHHEQYQIHMKLNYWGQPSLMMESAFHEEKKKEREERERKKKLKEQEKNRNLPAAPVPPAAPPLPATKRYKALAPGYAPRTAATSLPANSPFARRVVRKGAAKDSKKVGGLEKGEVIVALSTEETDGTVRVEFERGWVSVTAASGKVLLELMPDEPAAAPIPAPPSSDQRPSSSLRPKRRVNVPTSPAGNVPAPPTSPLGAAPSMRPQRTPSNRTSAPVDTDSDSRSVVKS